MLDADVIVVGGSVAGATTASFLARAGVRVIVLDRAQFPRAKPCGEGLMPHGIDVLADLGLEADVCAAGRALFGVRYTLANGQTAAGRFRAARPGGAGVALGIDRATLDALLLAAAGRRGAEVVDRFRVRELIWAGARVAGVTDGQRALTSRVVVGADGLHSSVRRLLGWERPRRGPRRWAVTGHVRLAAGRELPPEVSVVLLNGAEAYITPQRDDRALVAWLGGRRLLRHFSGDLAGAFAGSLPILARLQPNLRDACAEPEVRATGPFAQRARRVAGARALLVGDAAGFLDPITGEGMASALLQARAAAQTILRALAAGSDDLSLFERAHARITRRSDALTWLALALCASPMLSARALHGLQCRKGLFDALLAVSCGAQPLASLRPRDWLALLAGV